MYVNGCSGANQGKFTGKFFGETSILWLYHVMKSSLRGFGQNSYLMT